LIIEARKGASPEALEEALDLLRRADLDPKVVAWNERTLIVTDRKPGSVGLAQLAEIGIAERMVHPTLKAQLASRDFQVDPTVVKVRDVPIGGDRLTIIAGPCSVESREHLLETGQAVRKLGTSMLRGGVFKPRTSPYEFQGLGEEGLPLLAEVREATGLPVVTEVLEPEKVDVAAKYTDMLQIGTRNMQNFPLLKAVGRSKMPVLLKRGMAATIEEWLQAAEYILLEGNPNVVLCERGVRTFEKATRNTLDLSAVPIVKRQTHLPILVDPSHATGRRELVGPMAKAAVAAGADGILIEVHPKPELALSDSNQQLSLEEFARLIEELRPLAEVVGRGIR